MPLCGYHPDMGEGVRKLAQGLISSLHKKAEQHTITDSRRNTMSFCGYDPDMGKGVETFAEGLNKSLHDKSKRLSLDVRTQMDNEAKELGTLAELIDEQGSVGEEPDLHAWKGILHLILFLMQPKASRDLPRTQFEMVVRERAEQFDAAMRRFENMFEDNLELPLRERLQKALSAGRIES